MYGEKALNLIKELKRAGNSIPPYNAELINEIIKEILHLVGLNREHARTSVNNSEGTSLVPTVRTHHAIIQRNIRCLLAYHYNRTRTLRTMRWDFGSILPAEIKSNLSPSELAWLNNYSRYLADYMKSIGDENGLDLSVNLMPPKTLNIEVRCLIDYGKLELSDGTKVLLKENSRHYLPRADCEELIRLGVLQHLSS